MFYKTNGGYINLATMDALKVNIFLYRGEPGANLCAYKDKEEYSLFTGGYTECEQELARIVSSLQVVPEKLRRTEEMLEDIDVSKEDQE